MIHPIHFLHDRKTVRTGHLVLEDYDAATTAIVRIIQRSSYSQEIKDLKTRGEVKSSSSIANLNLVLDDHGVLRVKGRIAHPPVADAGRNQIILPRDHPVTTTIVRHTHGSIGHLGHEHLISKIHEKCCFFTWMNTSAVQLSWFSQWARMTLCVYEDSLIIVVK